MSKVLIVSGHTHINDDSFVNKRILKEVKALMPEVEIDSLCELYPDLKIDAKAEQQKLINADIVVFQFPLFWFNKPSLLQLWEEEVWLHGFSHGSTGDKLKGKKLIISVTTGAPEEVYANNLLDTLLKPNASVTAGFVGMQLVEPMVTTYGVSYMVRSDEKNLPTLEAKAKDHAKRLVEAIKKEL